MNKDLQREQKGQKDKLISSQNQDEDGVYEGAFVRTSRVSEEEPQDHVLQILLSALYEM